jgi:hypothetical protein
VGARLNVRQRNITKDHCFGCKQVRVAQWIARLPPKQKVAGSNPASDTFAFLLKDHQCVWPCFYIACSGGVVGYHVSLTH